MSKRSRVSEAEREQRRAEDRQRLQQAAEQLLSSEGWQRWVRIRAANGLARYSLLILSGSRHSCVGAGGLCHGHVVDGSGSGRGAGGWWGGAEWLGGLRGGPWYPTVSRRAMG
jgi:hypothetical protein